jgi:transposase
METNWVGVDTHKETLACYKNGRFKEFKTTQNGFESAIKWAGNDSKWAIEGAYCFGKPFVAYLINNGSEVYEVNPLLTKTWRRTIAISNPKNDFGDAKVISLFANSANLQQVSLETVKLKEKLTARNLAVKQRTKITNNIKMLFSTRGEALPFKDLKTIKACKWLSNNDDIIVKNFGMILKALNTTINELEKDIEANLPQKAQKLVEKFKGIGNITAATIYTETKGKLISEAALASYAGVAPVDNSSGKSVKHRNNKAGNRILNCVFFRLSIHQIRYNEEAKKYYEKKLAEGKSKRLARKHVARKLVKKVFKALVND